MGLDKPTGEGEPNASENEPESQRLPEDERFFKGRVEAMRNKGLDVFPNYEDRPPFDFTIPDIDLSHIKLQGLPPLEKQRPPNYSRDYFVEKEERLLLNEIPRNEATPALGGIMQSPGFKAIREKYRETLIPHNKPLPEDLFVQEEDATNNATDSEKDA